MTPEIFVGLTNTNTLTKIINLEQVLKYVSIVCEMSMDDLRNKKTRIRRYTTARQLFCYFAYEYTSDNLTTIGRYINKNHATVIHGKKTILDLKDFDKDIQLKFNLISNRLNNVIFNKENNLTEEIMDKYAV